MHAVNPALAPDDYPDDDIIFEAPLDPQVDAAVGRTIDRLIKSIPAFMFRMMRAVVYGLAALLLVCVQEALPVSYAVPFVVFLLAIPKRSLLLSELTLGVLIVLTFIPSGLIRF